MTPTPNPVSAEEMLALAEELSFGKRDTDTMRFSECVVPGKKGYAWGAIMSSSPAAVDLLRRVWNMRATVALALRALAPDALSPKGPTQ